MRTQPRRSFGELLGQHRAEAGLTQEVLAERAELSVRGLRYLEQGVRRPHPATVRRLADALALRPDEVRALTDAACHPPRHGNTRLTQPLIGSLPLPANPLVGREREVDAVVRLLGCRDVRVVTLTGPGGVGKTRLAIEAARQRARTSAEAVVWVALENLTDPSLVPSTVARAVGVAEAGGRSLPAAIVEALQDRAVLLLLDNFEQVAPAATLISDVVAGCPQLTVLVTSRAALGLRAEHEFAVGPLTAPSAAEARSLQQLAANPAVDLFLRRLQALAPEVTLNPGNAEVIAAICRALEGLPLALELAAARSRVLPLPAMLSRLQRRLGFLIGGAADAPARQRTMSAAIAWSYDLLAPKDQAMLRRLCVFRSGGTLAAVESLCDASGEEVLQRLEVLLRSSLIRLVGVSADEPRYSLLETVREYGWQLLRTTGAEDELGRRHARYYLGVAEEAEHGPSSAADAAWLDSVERDRDNLRAALDWALAHRDVELGLRLAAALWQFWYVRGHATEGRAQLRALLALADGTAPGAPHAAALLGAAQLALSQGDHDEAAALLSESVALYRATGDLWGTAAALLCAGFISRVREDYQSAQQQLAEAKALAEAHNNRFIVAASLHHLGLIERDARQNQQAAAALLEESLLRYQALALPRFIALVSLALGEVGRAIGHHARARHMFEQSLAIMEQVGEELGVPDALDDVAHLLMATADVRPAIRLAAAADRLRARAGTRPWPVLERRRADWLATARSQLSSTAFTRAWREGERLTRSRALTYALRQLAQRDGAAVAPPDSGPSPAAKNTAGPAGYSTSEGRSA